MMHLGRKKLIIISAVGLAVTAVLAAVLIFAGVFTDSYDGVPAEAPLISVLDDEPQQTAPDMLTGAWLEADRDFASDDSCVQSIEEAISAASEYGFNTLLVPLTVDGRAIYSSAVREKYGEYDYLSMIIESAHNRNMLVYVVDNPIISLPGARWNIESEITSICNEASSVCRNYSVDGYFVRNLSVAQNENYYESYLAYGGGVGYDVYRRELLTSAVRSLRSAVRSVSGAICFGAQVEPQYRRAFDVDFADTAAWAEDGIFDCVFISNPYTLKGDGTDTFESTAKFWKDSVNDQTRLCFLLSADRSAAEQWDKSELAGQAGALCAIGVRGIAVHSLADLRADTTGSTETLIEFLKKASSGADTAGALSITSPSATAYTTYDDSVTFIGASDPASPLILNGKEVERSDNGYFSLTEPLAEGLNTFIFEHKDNSLTYNITYKRAIIKSIAPGTNRSFDGGTTIVVGATVLKGSQVKVRLGDQVKVMTASEPDSDGDIGITSGNFISYTAEFTLPPATSAEQNLGNVIVTAANSGSTETLAGGSITIRSKNAEIDNSGSNVVTSTSLDGSYGVGPGIQFGVGDRYVAEVISYRTETFDGGLTDDRSRVTNAYLPLGTVDYCGDGDIVNLQADKNYRLLDYGKRVYSEDNIKIYKATLPDSNTITAVSTANDGRHTRITFDTVWKAPFNVTMAPQSYSDPYPNGSDSPSYAVSSITYEYIDIDFFYTVSAQGQIELDGNPVFSSARWIQNDGHYALRLYLKNKGKFYGWTAEYNSNNQLVFSFLDPVQIKEADNIYGYDLTGVKIAVDAGHGGSDPGAIGSDSTYTEAVLNLILAKKIQRELESIGAEVIMIRGNDTNIGLDYRAQVTSEQKPDLFISVHRNAASNSSARGYSNYYFMPYSKALAESVASSAGGCFSSSIGTKYYQFSVCRISACPSILTENGFVSNSDDLSMIKSDAHNEQVARATVNGIVNYLASLRMSDID